MRDVPYKKKSNGEKYILLSDETVMLEGLDVVFRYISNKTGVKPKNISISCQNIRREIYQISAGAKLYEMRRVR